MYNFIIEMNKFKGNFNLRQFFQDAACASVNIANIDENFEPS